MAPRSPEMALGWAADSHNMVPRWYSIVGEAWAQIDVTPFWLRMIEVTRACQPIASQLRSSLSFLGVILDPFAAISLSTFAFFEYAASIERLGNQGYSRCWCLAFKQHEQTTRDIPQVSKTRSLKAPVTSATRLQLFAQSFVSRFLSTWPHL